MKKSTRKILQVGVGLALVVIGIGWSLLNWADIMVVFRGVVPPCVAVAGMVCLFVASQEY